MNKLIRVPGHWFCDHCDDVVFMSYEKTTETNVPCPVCGHLSCNFVPEKINRTTLGEKWFGAMRREAGAQHTQDLFILLALVFCLAGCSVFTDLGGHAAKPLNATPPPIVSGVCRISSFQFIFTNSIPGAIVNSTNHVWIQESFGNLSDWFDVLEIPPGSSNPICVGFATNTNGNGVQAVYERIVIK